MRRRKNDFFPMRSEYKGDAMKKVMLVEDEEFILQGILCINDWAAMDMEVIHMAHNGQEALRKFKENPVDIVVTDVEMPLMNGLDLIREIKAVSPRTRCLILSGYDEFEYAQTALRLDVDEYILKPINEEQLGEALRHAARRLDEIDRKNAVSMDNKIGWIQFLKENGGLSEEEKREFIQMLPKLDGKKLFPALMKIDLESLDEADGINCILMEIQKHHGSMKPVYLKADVLLLLYYCEPEASLADAEHVFGEIQNTLESERGIMCFLAVASGIGTYSELPAAYGQASGLLRYRLLTGYGRCISAEDIRHRNTGDVSLDQSFLRKKILEKDQEGAFRYVEELFMNILESEANVDALYQIALRIAILIQDIKLEYKMDDSHDLKGLSELFEKIYHAEDIFSMRAVLMLEIAAAITSLHTSEDHYTPVVREILNYMKENYGEDMSLKVLSQKYCMNTSYLGQIFQKEVGCSFNQYLSKLKNEKAKELILQTNMKITDIAREVGYPDTSYFYKKFKQCYGVSPASLRSMKKY